MTTAFLSRKKIKRKIIIKAPPKGLPAKPAIRPKKLLKATLPPALKKKIKKKES